MEASAGLVAGSHNRNEFVVIHGHEEPKPLNMLSGHVCQICGEDVGLNTDGELLVACNECGFPVCRPCYEYERREGNQSCPQCNTRYKRQKGSPRVEGDDDEEDVDDIEHEFNVETQQRNRQQITEAMLHGRMSYGRGPDDENSQIAHNPELPPQIPVLANGHSSGLIHYFESKRPGNLTGESRTLGFECKPPGETCEDCTEPTIDSRTPPKRAVSEELDRVKIVSFRVGLSFLSTGVNDCAMFCCLGQGASGGLMATKVEEGVRVRLSPHRKKYKSPAALARWLSSSEA